MKEKASSNLFWCLFFIYICNVIGKTTYSAVTVALVDEAILTKTQAGLIGGLFWLLYAAGQFGGGFFAEKHNPYHLIKLTILSSTCANVLMAFQRNYLVMLLIWGVNGILQFGLWPAILKIVSTQIVEKQRTVAMARLGYCFCIGSIVSYILTACLLEVLSWQYIFICCGIANGISYVATIVAQRRFATCLEQQEQAQQEILQQKSQLTTQMVWKSGLIFFCVIMFVRSFLDSSIKNWMPTILVETYDVVPSFTLLLSVGLLITNIFGVTICTYIYNRTRHDELYTLRFLYLAIAPMMFLLLQFDKLHIYVLTVLFSCITLLVYGSGPILMINYPFRFHMWGIASTVGGIINCFSALGNVAASYGSGYVADHFGWNSLMVIWLITVALVVVVTITLIPIWKKFRGK